VRCYTAVLRCCNNSQALSSGLDCQPAHMYMLPPRPLLAPLRLRFVRFFHAHQLLCCVST
jgi:hypothetical protein